MGNNTLVKGKTRTMLMTIAIVCTMLIGYVDYLTGFELRIDVFYLIPISFVAWYISKKTGMQISLVSVLLIFLSDLLSKPDHHVHFIDLWNISMILLFFVIVTLSLSKLRITLDEQRRLAVELQKALDDIKATNESLESFSYSVSHDLRGPLWRIEGFAELMAEKYSDRLDEQGKDYIGRICSNTQRMKDLIEALLKLSRYSRSDLNRSPVDLTALVRGELEENSKSWPERKVELITAEGVTADADPALLQVIIFNLVANAWKFTKLRSVAKIEFGVTEIEGKDVYFVRDNGAGFSMVNAKRLFSPFQRFHSESEFPGFGIGLATVQRIIHRHGGRIWAESEVDKGATFYFTL
jgi:light-regulated signal transduction histidine kinase (bacteriophytochrome)